MATTLPTVRSVRFGKELRRLRQDACLDQAAVAKALECDKSKVSQVENGLRGLRPLEVSRLLELFGIEDGGYADSLRRLGREIRKRDWWGAQGPLLGEGTKLYLTLEEDSSRVRTYEPLVLPGMVQTQRYMTGIFERHHDSGRVQAEVVTRIKRQELLRNKLDFSYSCVIDVPTIHRIQGNAETAVEQWQHLIDVSLLPNVTLQVLELDATLPSDQYGSFTLFSIPVPRPMDIVWTEHLSGGTVLEGDDSVLRYAKAWESLSACALPPQASRAYIRSLIEERRS